MSIIAAILPAVLSIIDKFLPDAEASNKLKSEMITKLLEADQKQIEVNQMEAANPNIFVSGWRPAVGWFCMIMWALYYIIALVVNPIVVYNGHVPITLPDISEMQNLLYALLGFGALRTVEKLKIK